jgi:hypothetical protein
MQFLSDVSKTIALLKVPRLRPLVLLITVTLKGRSVWNNGEMILTGGNRI